MGHLRCETAPGRPYRRRHLAGGRCRYRAHGRDRLARLDRVASGGSPSSPRAGRTSRSTSRLGPPRAAHATLARGAPHTPHRNDQHFTMKGDRSMSDANTLDQLRQQAETRAFIPAELERRFAPEDDALRAALQAARDNDMPAIQISPLQGKLLQVLAAACGSNKILAISALAGYSGIWLARALPPNGRLISLDVSAKHAAVARASLARAGLADRAAVRVGPGEQLLPALASEA